MFGTKTFQRLHILYTITAVLLVAGQEMTELEEVVGFDSI